MKIYAKKLTPEPLQFDIVVNIDADAVYEDLEYDIAGAVDLSKFKLPKGPVISKGRKLLTQQMINDYECFVSDVETLCEVNYGLVVTYDNVSPDHSHYYNYLAQDDDGNIIARFRFRFAYQIILRIGLSSR